MSFKCPICEARLSEWTVRKKFKCPSCKKELESNSKLVRTCCVIFGGILSALLFLAVDRGDSSSIVIAIAKLMAIPVVLLVYWIAVNVGGVIVIRPAEKRHSEAE